MHAGADGYSRIQPDATGCSRMQADAHRRTQNAGRAENLKKDEKHL